jgi:DNA-binding NtrC family response regulator
MGAIGSENMFYLDCFIESDKNFPVNSYYDEDPEKLAKAGAELLKVKNDIDKDELIGRTLEEITHYYVEKTLKLTNGSREDASRILGIGERTIYRYIQSWKDRPMSIEPRPNISGIVEIRISKETRGMSPIKLDK